MSIKFEPRDVWIGWFWDRRDDGTHHYVCLIPMVVIHWVTKGPRIRQPGERGTWQPTPGWYPGHPDTHRGHGCSLDRS